MLADGIGSWCLLQICCSLLSRGRRQQLKTDQSLFVPMCAPVCGDTIVKMVPGGLLRWDLVSPDGFESGVQTTGSENWNLMYLDRWISWCFGGQLSFRTKKSSYPVTVRAAWYLVIRFPGFRPEMVWHICTIKESGMSFREFPRLSWPD